jgi:hypothetical protein
VSRIVSALKLAVTGEKYSILVSSMYSDSVLKDSWASVTLIAANPLLLAVDGWAFRNGTAGSSSR